MGKNRTKSMYKCLFCNLIGWQQLGQYEAHIKKSHPEHWNAYLKFKKLKEKLK